VAGQAGEQEIQEKRVNRFTVSGAVVLRMMGSLSCLTDLPP
jgi:hypothetical protein